MNEEKEKKTQSSDEKKVPLNQRKLNGNAEQTREEEKQTIREKKVLCILFSLSERDTQWQRNESELTQICVRAYCERERTNWKRISLLVVPFRSLLYNTHIYSNWSNVVVLTLYAWVPFYRIRSSRRISAIIILAMRLWMRSHTSPNRWIPMWMALRSTQSERVRVSVAHAEQINAIKRRPRRRTIDCFNVHFQSH